MKKVLKGKLRSGKHPVPGAKIVVSIANKKDHFSETYSNHDGDFYIDLDLIKTKTPIKKIEIKVFGEDEKTPLITTFTNLMVKVINIKVPVKLFEGYTPNVVVLEPSSGSFFEQRKLDQVKMAIQLLNPNTDTRIPLAELRELCPLPNIARVPNLMDLTWGVLGNQPGAAETFRDVLEKMRLPNTQVSPINYFKNIEDRFQNTSFNTGIMPISMMLSPFPIPDIGGVGGARIDPCLLTKNRVLALGVATLMSSRNSFELVRNFRNLEDGFCGFGRMNNLYRESIKVLRGGNPGQLLGRFQNFDGICGPADEPPRSPCQLPELPNCDLERINCLHEIIEKLGGDTFAVEPYYMESVIPNNVCPGDVIIIRGRNFGNTGEVIFQHVAAGIINTDARRWTDTEIEVVVPENAGTGDISLKTLARIDRICDRVITLNRSGNKLPIVSDTAYVSLRINNQYAPNPCFSPGETISIDWSATHNNVRIDIQHGPKNKVFENLPSVGSISYTLPDEQFPQDVNISARAQSTCGAHLDQKRVQINVPPEITIEGVEFTQGIQKFSIDGANNNSVRLISGKDTIARVYISCSRNGFARDRVRVSGVLEVEVDKYYRSLHPINGTSPTNPMGNPFIIAGPKGSIDRQQTNDTLNFRIPADLCDGTKRIRLRVFTNEVCGSINQKDEYLSQTWIENEVLRVRFVRIKGTHVNSLSARPSANQCRFTVLRGFDLIPSKTTDIGPAWQATWNTGLNFSKDDDALQDLLYDLEDKHNCDWWEALWEWTGADCPDDDGAKWVGLTSIVNRGIARRSGNTAVSAIYSDGLGFNAIVRIKTAHELSHTLGFKHVNIGGTEGPFYNHPNGGRLQDVAFDPYWNQTIPQVTTDFMGYGTNRWPSADSWERMINLNF